VVAPGAPDRREQAKAKERLIEREQVLSEHMTDREKHIPAGDRSGPDPDRRSRASACRKKNRRRCSSTAPWKAHLPPISILDPAEKKQLNYSPESLAAVGHLLEIKLKEFGVEVTVDSIHPGPVITRYEIQPAAGVKVSRIANLAKDLARSLAVTSVRVVEVIPGKTTVGIEIP
jgi:S-DNA-T family DNA segregation ATPase FtsK/SpoIIIE